MRDGLVTILSSRTALGTRQQALVLAGTLSELYGWRWVLGGAGSALAARGGTALTVLAEVAGVEVPLLLCDAMDPEQPVPDMYGAAVEVTAEAAAANLAAARERRRAQAAAAAAAEAEARDAKPLGEQLRELQRTLVEGMVVADGAAEGARKAAMEVEEEDDAEDGEQAPQPHRPPRVEDLPEPGRGKGAFAEGTTTAGARAEALLPPLFALLEAVVSALVEGEEGGGVVLEADVTERAFGRLMSVFQVVLEYLSHAAKQEIQASPLVDVAAVRALGRFLAEVPDALRQPLVAVLPYCLRLRAPDSHGGVADGTLFLCPALLMVAQDRAGAGALLGCGAAAELLRALATCLSDLRAGHHGRLATIDAWRVAGNVSRALSAVLHATAAGPPPRTPSCHATRRWRCSRPSRTWARRRGRARRSRPWGPPLRNWCAHWWHPPPPAPV
ncbi:unnamed protein product [Pedinophyceae sp. YPF-701]|nr:unnamed protein product [Pedinophyceae sp. YPF-701]